MRIESIQRNHNGDYVCGSNDSFSSPSGQGLGWLLATTYLTVCITHNPTLVDSIIFLDVTQACARRDVEGNATSTLPAFMEHPPKNRGLP